MAMQNIEEVLRSADALTPVEMLVAAQRLIERARGRASAPIDVNALAGTLVLDEDPLVIQERMRREWD